MIHKCFVQVKQILFNKQINEKKRQKTEENLHQHD